MSAEFAAKAQDAATGSSKGAIAQGGGQLTVVDLPIAGDMGEGATLDETARWTKATANGGTVTQSASGAIVIAPSTATNGSAYILSNFVIPLAPGGDIIARATIAMTTSGVASMTREFILIVDGSNYLGFVQSGTDWVARLYSGGAAFQPDVPINMVKADDLRPMNLEIRVSRCPDLVSMIWNSGTGPVSLATFEQSASLTRMFGAGGLAQLKFRAVNSGSAVDNKMTVYGATVTRRMTSLVGAPRLRSIRTTSGLICRGPGYLLNCVKQANAGGASVLYDNTAGSGTALMNLTAASTTLAQADAPVFFMNGLYLNVTGGSDPVQTDFIPL